MSNNKEKLSKLKDALLSKSRKGNLKQILKDIVKNEFCIKDSSQQYDEYEKLIDDKIDSIKSTLENEDISGVNIVVETDAYVRITVSNNLSKIKKYIKTLNGDDFEDLCQSILDRSISGDVTKTSKYSFEDKHCVDFIGDLIVIGDISAKAKLYVQVKSQSSNISLNNLKEFIGGVKLVMSEKGLESGYMHSYVLLYICASEFHKDAIDYMNKIGIIHIDGYEMANLIEKYNIDYKSFKKTK